MAAEMSQAEDDHAALAFAGGCLFAAASARVADVDTRFGAGIWAIAVATACLAMFQLACAAHGVAAILGGPDGMREALMQDGAAPATIARYDAARPLVVGCSVALGLTQLATAWFLSREQLRRFLAAWSIALVIAAVAVVTQLSILFNIDGVPSEFHGLLLQSAAVPALLAWYRHRQVPHEREQ